MLLWMMQWHWITNREWFYKSKTDSEITVSSVTGACAVTLHMHHIWTVNSRVDKLSSTNKSKTSSRFRFSRFPKKPILYSICIQLKSHSIIHLPNKEETPILPRSAAVCGLISVSRFKTNEIEFFTLATFDGRTNMLQNSLALETILPRHVSWPKQILV